MFSMIRTETVIAVDSVETSSKWYQALLNCKNTHENGQVFDQLIDTDGTVLLCLHSWGDHDHPTLSRPGKGMAGNGLMLFFRVDDFEQAWERARSLGAAIEEEPHVNPLAGHNEFALRDPDGYSVTICSPYK